MKILIIRNDKLGDFSLALPAFKALKESMPDSQLTAFVPSYTAPVVNCTDYIDAILVDHNQGILKLSKEFKKFDRIITLYSSKRVALAGFLSGVPYRLAPATKWWQFFYNNRLTQRRSKSLKPEFVYNLDLIDCFLKNVSRVSKKVSPPYLKSSFKPVKNSLIIHPGTGGSANNLSLGQYAKLADLLYQKKPNLKLEISAGPNEQAIAQELSDRIKAPSCVFESDNGLLGFIDKLASTEIFIGGSTGPLHLAGALNIKTVGFYPNKRSATSLRWQTLNDVNKRLSFSPADGGDDMGKVAIEAAAKSITEFI